MSTFLFQCFAFLLGARRRFRLALFHVFVWLSTRHHKEGTPCALLVRTDHLGDAIISGNAFRVYKDFFARRKLAVILVCDRAMEAFFRDCPYFDQIFPIDVPLFQRSFFYRLKTCRQLASQHAEYAIKMPCIFGSGDVASILTITSCAKITCGILPAMPDSVKKSHEGMDAHLPSDKKGKVERCLGRLFTKREKLLLSDAWFYRPFRHAFRLSVPGQALAPTQEEECRLLQKVTGDISLQPENLPPFWLDNGKPSGLPEETSYLLIPGASNPARAWPEQYFAALIDLLHERFPKWHACICGVENERPLAEKIISHVHSNANVHNLCGKSSLQTLYATVCDAAFVISNDTGTAHLAASLGKPTFVLLGYGQFDGKTGLYFPNPSYPKAHAICHTPPPACRLCSWLCHRPEEERFACIATISPQEAWKQILPVLDQEMTTTTPTPPHENLR